ncbi:DUF3718 domain-containing protein [Salinimonas sediminis]|uniref:DUF3718 domain-containing protein n=1 Tax=Salinimonas sediminis TaxID=2303538 RepID=A0A346NN12_9ALTE|nr:DUF3718 domain-containing protein [Salinimonas sediminis]AXR06919.1 DUF3718 domain-containing protein [Salinimonas sediminis]
MLKVVQGFLLLLTICWGCSVQAGINEDLSNICRIVVNDDKGELRKKIRTLEIDYRLKLHDYYDEITCDGHSLLRTAILMDAQKVGILMIKKLPRRILSSPEPDGKTLQLWVEEQNLQNNKIAKILNQRM